MIKRIEILEAQLRTTADQQERIDILNELIEKLYRIDLKRATTLLDEVAALVTHAQTKPFPHSVGIAEYQVNLARLALYSGRFENSLQNAQQIIVDYPDSAYELIRCKALNISGLSLIRLGNPSDALALFIEALNIATRLGDSEYEAEIYSLFAILYVNLGDYEAGAVYFQKSLTLCRQLGDRVNEARALANLCMSYRDLGRYTESLQCGHASLGLVQQLDLKSIKLWTVSNLANTYLAIGQSESAFAYFQQAAKLAEQFEDTFDQTSTLLSMARAFLVEENYPLASSYAQLVLEVAQVSKQLGVQFEAHELLAAVYKTTGDFEQALAHYESFHQIKERIFNKEVADRLKQLEVAHRTETAQRDAEIYQLRYVELQREITERERMQKALVQAQKLESLGVLAGGVAHDFNNLLVSILGHTDLAMYKLAEIHPARAHLLKARDAAEQAATLARKMLAYSGRGRFQLSHCHISALIEENRALWQRLIGLECQLLFEAIQKECPVEIDKGQIEQLFMNLLLNAAEANATTITIQITSYALAQDEVRFWQYTAQPLSAGRYLLLVVADNGCGMDSMVLEKIFDPFFTTKFTGRGLGMAASLGIIRGHGGGIAVQSQLDAGTSFEILLPIVTI